MKISIISFTRQGGQLAEKVKECLPDKTAELYQKQEQGVVSWAGEQFAGRRAIVFIGACGIAVRAIAPFVKDKLSDSPVLVMDEMGRYVIPLLSGHVGGANELAELIADRINAVPVITTATDIHGKFAVDVFAKKNDLTILNKEGIAGVSAKVLREEKIMISAEDDLIKDDFMDNSRIPTGIELVPYPPGQKVDVMICSMAKKDRVSQEAVLWLIPKEYVLGIGCKRGKTKEEISKVICKNLERLQLDLSDIAVISSIERKKEEKGICCWAQENRIIFQTFSEEELKAVEGDFHGSSFVEHVVGVDNVCERAALAACGAGGKLILSKQAENGITLAVAKKKRKIGW